MQIVNDLSDGAVRSELGARLARTRLDRNLTQEGLAERAGVSRDTLRRLERGQGASLTALLRVLRALGLLERLEALVPPPLPSPIEELERAEGRRQRARPRRGATGGEPWRWGTP